MQESFCYSLSRGGCTLFRPCTRTLGLLGLSMADIRHLRHCAADAYARSLWQPLPYLITVGIALCFTIAGMYGLAYSGAVRRLPLQTWVVWFTCIVFLLRAVVWLVVLLSDFTLLELTSTLGAALLGLCFLPCRCACPKDTPRT